MKTIFILFVFVHCVLGVECQSPKMILNNVAITFTSKNQNKNNPFSFLSNPAVLIKSKKKSIGFFSERKYLINELSHHLVAFSYPYKIGNFGLGLDYLGGTNYNETTFLFDYAHALTGKSAIGLLFHTKINKNYNYKSEYSTGASLGMHIDLSDNLTASFSVNDNLMESEIHQKLLLNNLDVWISMGFELSKQSYLSAQMVKTYKEQPNLILGFMYAVKNRVCIKYGFISGSNEMFAGIGFSLNKMNLEVLNSFHQQLGYTPSLLISSNPKE